MSLFVNIIEKIEAKVGHSLHPAVVSIPIGAWTVSAISEFLALMTKKSSFDDSAKISTAVGLAGASASLLTGLHDYSYIPKNRPSHSIATTHALGNITATALFATAFVLRIPCGNGKLTQTIARLLTFCGTIVIVYTGWLGGKLVEEQGEAVLPIIKEQNEAEKSQKAA